MVISSRDVLIIRISISGIYSSAARLSTRISLYFLFAPQVGNVDVFTKKVDLLLINYKN